jgi:hypothetical protein
MKENTDHRKEELPKDVSMIGDTLFEPEEFVYDNFMDKVWITRKAIVDALKVKRDSKK